jgi:hypothetical protein
VEFLALAHFVSPAAKGEAPLPRKKSPPWRFSFHPQPKARQSFHGRNLRPAALRFTRSQRRGSASAKEISAMAFLVSPAAKGEAELPRKKSSPWSAAKTCLPFCEQTFLKTKPRKRRKYRTPHASSNLRMERSSQHTHGNTP